MSADLLSGDLPGVYQDIARGRGRLTAGSGEVILETCLLDDSEQKAVGCLIARCERARPT